MKVRDGEFTMFSPDGPNDIAPPGFNALEPAAGLPLSPLGTRRLWGCAGTLTE